MTDEKRNDENNLEITVDADTHKMQRMIALKLRDIYHGGKSLPREDLCHVLDALTLSLCKDRRYVVDNKRNYHEILQLLEFTDSEIDQIDFLKGYKPIRRVK